ncbi:MAG: hypothetical protein AAF125_01300 [Chloroflexota bacterium]
MRFLGWGLALCVMFLSACTTTPAEPTVRPSALDQPKRLATVFLSPTPNEAERQATRFAATPTVNVAALAPPTETPTPYIGIFLGDSAANVPFVALADVGPATPTPLPSRCLVEPDTNVLGTRWQTEPAVVRGLGCAIEGVFPFEGRTQVFQDGVMYTQDDSRTWAIGVGEPGEFWFVEEPPADAAPDSPAEAPPGFLLPDGLFRALWSSNVEISTTLGFAVLPPITAELGTQRFEGGTLFYDGETDQVWALLIDGLAYGPY